MPCSDGINHENDNRLLTQRNSGLQKEYNILVKKVQWFDGALCAVLSELERLCIAEDVIEDASKSGCISLKEYWVEHKKKDEERMAKKLGQYSEDELEILRKLLIGE